MGKRTAWLERRIVRWTLCVLVLAVVSGGCKKKAEAPPPPPPTPTPVIPLGSVVFVQKGHLARLDLESSQVTPLTSGKSTEWFPACSPKGDQIVYWSNYSEGGAVGPYNLWRMNLDGTDRIQMTFEESEALPVPSQNLRMNSSPSWSSDGKRVLYAVGGDIWIMDSDGFNPETLLIGASAVCPILSPDGKTVLYLSIKGDVVYNLWAFNISDKSVKKITDYTDWSVGSPSFSADGRKVLFNLYRSNVTQIYTANAADGSDPLNLTTNNKSLCPRFAVNDRKILYCSFGTGEDMVLNIYMENVNGTDAKALTSEGGVSPSWSAARILAAAPLPTPASK